MAYVIKHTTKESQAFDRQKLHASLVKACLSVQTPIGEAVMTAEKVCNAVIAWLEHREEVTSADIRRKSAEALHTYNHDAAELYEQVGMIT